MTKILGISAFYHDSAAALIDNGKIIAAAQEERFSRKKHDASFPINAINYVIEESGFKEEDIKSFVFYDKPFLKFERLIETYIAFAPFGLNSFRMAMPVWLREKLFLKDLLLKELRKKFKEIKSSNIYFSEHHMSHAASAFYPSPFKKAVILSLDGVGEWATSTIGVGNEENIEIKKEIHFPHSLGLLYSAFTYYLGFKVNSGEYKVMGLAPYGKPKYSNIILSKLIDLKSDGSFRLNQSYFNYSSGLKMTNRKFSELFGQPVRKPDKDPLTQFHMDIAASIQEVTEIIVMKIVNYASEKYKLRNLCLAGGVALNCVANGKIIEKSNFENIWIQPAAGDAGGAIGCALALWHNELKKRRIISKNDQMQGSYLGPSFSGNLIENDLNNLGASYKKLTETKMLKETAKALSNKKAIGWFQGRMEFGPRALGNRSILGDPRSDKMQKNLNLKVKYRESFRPFAPSVLHDEVSNWFDISTDSPYMLFVANIKKEKTQEMSDNEKKLFGIDLLNIKRSEIPAVTHVDYSARIQTVYEDTNNKYYKLIKKFKEITKCPVLINTSFNIRGEPIVNTPRDAFDCFMGTELDILVIGNFYLEKNKQNTNLKKDYKNKFEPD